MIIVSYLILVVNPLTSLMIAWLVVRVSATYPLNLVIRSSLSAMAVSFMMQAGEHIHLIVDYRPPRAYAWMILHAAVHTLVWSTFFERVKSLGLLPPRQNRGILRHTGRG